MDIRRMILTGELPPGQKLKIDALREMLDTGASPVREALSLLTSDQLVERLDQRGFRAAATSRANFEEILRLRCALEEMALRDSIAHATETWEEALVLSHYKMDRAPRDDLDGFEQHHKAFHMALIAGSQSPVLLKFCNQLYDLNIRYRYLAIRSDGYRNRNVSKEHTAILDAALAKDADLAAERLMSHYQNTGAFLAGLFKPS